MDRESGWAIGLRTGIAFALALAGALVALPEPSSAEEAAAPTPRRARPLVGEVRVEVRDPAGAPVAGAKVCLGTAAIPHYFGVRDTDEAGVVRYPRVRRDFELAHRVAGEGFEGQAGTLPPAEPVGEGARSAAVATLAVSLAPGKGGPPCPANETGVLRISVEPAAGSIVCLGTMQDRDAFGGYRIGADGRLEVPELPRTQPVRVRVDAPGFRRHDDVLLLEERTERSYTLVAGGDENELVLEKGVCRFERVRQESGGAAPAAPVAPGSVPPAPLEGGA